MLWFESASARNEAGAAGAGRVRLQERKVTRSHGHRTEHKTVCSAYSPSEHAASAVAIRSKHGEYAAPRHAYLTTGLVPRVEVTHALAVCAHLNPRASHAKCLRADTIHQRWGFACIDRLTAILPPQHLQTALKCIEPATACLRRSILSLVSRASAWLPATASRQQMLSRRGGEMSPSVLRALRSSRAETDSSKAVIATQYNPMQHGAGGGRKPTATNGQGRHRLAPCVEPTLRLACWTACRLPIGGRRHRRLPVRWMSGRRLPVCGRLDRSLRVWRLRIRRLRVRRLRIRRLPVCGRLRRGCAYMAAPRSTTP